MASARGGGRALLGLLLICASALLVDGAREAVGACLARDGYTLTELEVLDVQVRGSSRRNVRGRVLATGAELWVEASRFPELLQSANGVVFRPGEPQALRGRRVPIWFHPKNASFAFGDLRVLRAAEGAALPGWPNAAGRLLALAALLGLATGLIGR